MPRPSIYDEKDNSLPEVLLMRHTTDKPFMKEEITKDTNCCTNGSCCWYLFCICGLCERD